MMIIPFLMSIFGFFIFEDAPYHKLPCEVKNENIDKIYSFNGSILNSLIYTVCIFSLIISSIGIFAPESSKYNWFIWAIIPISIIYFLIIPSLILSHINGLKWKNKHKK